MQGERLKAAALRGVALLRRAAFLLLPAFTAALLALAYPKFSLWPLAWAALAPLAYFLLRARGAAASAAGGWAAGFLFYLLALYWIYPTMRAGGAGPGLAAAGLLLLAALQGLEFLLPALFSSYFRRTGAWPYVFASSWALMEWGKVLANKHAAWFPWFKLAYTQWNRPELVQIVSVTGPYGLSWALCLAGALLGAAFARREKPLRAALSLWPAALLFGGLWAWGARELARPPAGPVETVDALLLQPCVDLYDKWQAGKAAEIKAGLESLAGAGADLVVWPENALPGWLEEPGMEDWVVKTAGATGAMNLVGSASRGDGRHVSAFLFCPGGRQLGEYRKRVLVPFGEYVPLRGLLSRYIEPIGALGEFYPGTARQELLEVKGLKTSAVICYESVFPYLFSEDAARGAQLFVNVTNDGWYLDTAAPYQHLAANVFRAAETRRPLLRAANNGISAYIDGKGRIVDSLPLNERGALRVKAEVDTGAGQSVYVAQGDLFAWLCLLFCAAFLLAVLV